MWIDPSAAVTSAVFTAVTHAARDGGRRRRSIQRREVQFGSLGHGNAVRLRRAVLMVGGSDGRVLVSREFAMVQPDHTRATMAIDSCGLPTAIAGRIAAGHRHGAGKRSAAVVRACIDEPRAAGAFARPDNGDDWRIAALNHNARRLLAVHTRVAVLVVDAHRRSERQPAVAAHGQKNVRRAARQRRAPGDRNELSVCRERRRSARASWYCQRGGERGRNQKLHRIPN